LTKTGAGTLTLRGGGTGTGGINVQAGKLAHWRRGGRRDAKPHHERPWTRFHQYREITFSDATNTRTVNLGANGGTISVTTAGAGVIFSAPDTLASGGTITKAGDGALRMRADHTSLSSNWYCQRRNP
jgi:autotransporter-associated beta strand protein